MLDFVAFGELPDGLQYVNGGNAGAGSWRVLLLGSAMRTMRPRERTGV